MKSRLRRSKNYVQEEWAKRADITMIYTWHTHPKLKFGAKKCRELYLDMIRNHFAMCDKWQCKKDNSHYLIMEEELKVDGIDVDALIKEAEEMAERYYNGK